MVRLGVCYCWWDAVLDAKNDEGVKSFFAEVYETYIKYFEMELFNAQKLRNQIEEYAEEKVLRRKTAKLAKNVLEIDEDYENILSGSLAIKVAEGAFKDVQNDKVPLLAQGFVSVTRKFSFAKDVRNWLVGKLVAEFPDCEVTHDVVAQRFLDEDAYEENQVPHMKTRIENCYNSFEESLRTINTKDMWATYLSTIDNLENGPRTYSEKYVQVTRRAFETTGKFGEELFSLLMGTKEYQQALAVINHVINQELAEGVDKITNLLVKKMDLLMSVKSMKFEEFSKEFFDIQRICDEKSMHQDAERICVTVANYLQGNNSYMKDPHAKDFFERCFQLRPRCGALFEGVSGLLAGAHI
ncbi:unnamed protein product [Notodromas monacha]|uniref:Uncharacterized protein n=1 Tax=Notodromas monacha TaxID=399045 RepID=A0A7R9GBS2_9CRUS|nr:unnamed protein product [Notodromas monacha]CAG0916683.1 unnamed protein product [Notodromas monacha]